MVSGINNKFILKLVIFYLGNYCYSLDSALYNSTLDIIFHNIAG
ncbi:Uncharacterised protein [Yersinia intermedia]|nr:Uncharacterised protein [Yersinia intermedia]